MISGCFFELLNGNAEMLFAVRANSFASTDKLVSALPAEWQEKLRMDDRTNNQQMLLITLFLRPDRASVRGDACWQKKVG